MKADGLYRIIGGIALAAISVTVAAVKFHSAGGIVAVVSADPLLPVGCLAIALLGALVSVSGWRALKRIEAMTRLIEAAVREKNRVVTAEIAKAVGVHEVEVRERIDEMIKERRIGSGTRITYVGGEKVVK